MKEAVLRMSVVAALAVAAVIFGLLAFLTLWRYMRGLSPPMEYFRRLAEFWL